MAVTVTPTSFREAFPAFANATTYPDAVINFWIVLGAKLHSDERYGDVIDVAVSLFVAHNLALEYNSQQGSGGGQAPGQVVGALTGSHVDKVGYTRDAGSAMDPANGHWNLSSYGLRWVYLMRMFGAGPVQLGVPTADDVWPGAWPGPMPGP